MESQSVFNRYILHKIQELLRTFKYNFKEDQKHFQPFKTKVKLYKTLQETWECCIWPRDSAIMDISDCNYLHSTSN